MVTLRKLQEPNSKLQASPKIQISKALILKQWNLLGAWFLDLEIFKIEIASLRSQ